MNFIFAAFAAYFLGAIPTAYVFGRLLKGIDIRHHGSGNVGATNAFRTLGKGPGAVVLLLDILKGALALTVVGNLFGVESVYGRTLLGIIAVVGHNWTVFLQFKGGKGIATSLGVLIGLAVHYPSLRAVLLLVILAWVVCFFISGYVSLSSLAAALVLPLAMLLTRQITEFVVLSFVFCVFIWIRHIPNIRRLAAGQEHRVKLPFKK